MPALRALILAAAFAGAAAPAAAARSACSGIADPGARLGCYDRGGAGAGRAAPRPAFAPPPGGPPDLSAVCTPSRPCVGPRGGVYYITPSGHRRYLPRG